jgi:hypothetical protein
LRKDHAIKPHDYQGLHDTAGNVRKLQETNRTKSKSSSARSAGSIPARGTKFILVSPLFSVS